MNLSNPLWLIAQPESPEVFRRDQSNSINQDEICLEICLEIGLESDYVRSMADRNPIDPSVSNEDAVEVDSETAAAIEEGLRDAKAGHMVSSEEVRKLIPQWISKFSTRNAR